MIVRKTINRLAEKPRNLFLIDSLGAFLTAFLLFVVLRNYHDLFGVAVETLTLLSGIAVMFCIYSATCFLFLRANWVPFIKAISFANILYCIITLGLVFITNSQLTLFGRIYFLSEIFVVFGLVFIELGVVKEINKGKSS